VVLAEPHGGRSAHSRLDALRAVEMRACLLLRIECVKLPWLSPPKQRHTGVTHLCGFVGACKEEAHSSRTAHAQTLPSMFV
jgi:hypothetical protein